MTTITPKSLYKHVVNIAEFLYKFLTIFTHTFTFIFINAVKEIQQVVYKWLDKIQIPLLINPSLINPSLINPSLINPSLINTIILTILILNLFMMLLLLIQRRNSREQINLIQTLESEINYIKNNMIETEKKMSQMDRKIKSIEKEQKAYI